MTKGIKTENGGAWESLKKFIPYYKPYRAVFTIDLICAVCATAAELVFPRMVGIITKTYLPIGEFLPILRIAFLLIFLRVVEVACKYFITKHGHILGAKIERDMRSKLFGHIELMPHKFFDNVKVGTLMSRLTTDLFDITEFAHHCPEEFFVAGLKIVGAFSILLIVHIEYWILTLCLFVMLPIMVIFAVKYNHKMRTIHKASRVQMAEINAQSEDTLSGIRVVKSFTNEKLEQDKFDKGNKKFLTIKKRNYHYMGTFSSGIKLFDAIVYMTIVVLGGYLRLDAGVFVEYLLYASTLLTTIRVIAEYTEQFQRGITAFERYQEVLDTPITLENKPNAVELTDIKGDICFDNVTFRYSDESHIVLNKLNLTVNAGETFAIVGPSGSGKTTIANLIPRFYDITSGSISVDGKDIRDVTLESLRGSIGVVQQDVFLFWGTVAENIAYGKPSATLDEIKAAARMAGAEEFIEKLPDGYDSYVGERGVKLSGGQKQRISIARLFLKNPPILILDEATSSLDNESEVIVQQSLDRLAKGRTAIIIAHRLSTIRNADRIIVLTEAGVVEDGTHDELMKHDGLYKKLYELSLTTSRLSERAL